MELSGYKLEGVFFDADEVKDLPGVYVVLSLRVLDVGESGWRYREPVSRGVTKPLYVHQRLKGSERKDCWQNNCGQGHKIAYAVLYEPNDERRLEIEKDLRGKFSPPCGYEE